MAGALGTMSRGNAVMVVMVLSFMFAAPVVVGFEAEVKPNNYPNFEFTESETTPTTTTSSSSSRSSSSSSTAEVKPHNYNNFQFTESESVPARENKPNNYPNFEFTESPGVKPTRTTTNTNTNAAHQYTTTMPDARDRFSGYNNNNNNDNYVFDADHQYYSNNNPSAVTYDVETDPTSQSFFSADRGLPTYSTEVDRSSYSSQQQQQGYESFTNSEVRVHSQHPASQKQAAPAARTGSSRFYTPASDPDFAFRFAQPASTLSKEARFGVNSFVIDSAADETVYSQFNFDNSDATSDPTATYGSTSPAVSSSYDTQLRSRNNNNNNNNNNAGGHGCANMYWAEHPKQWPSFFSINTQVAQAFGTKAGDIYGTTTLLQALYDNRSDGYSQLLSHGTASLLNSYTKPNYALRHDTVISQFLGALASRTAAGVQAQKFLNANHAYGPNECQN